MVFWDAYWKTATSTTTAVAAADGGGVLHSYDELRLDCIIVCHIKAYFSTLLFTGSDVCCRLFVE